MSAESIVRLRIGLQDTDPEIWRLVEVPAKITLKDLHVVIQAAMGWENAHLFEFHVGRERIVGPGMGDDVGFGGKRPTSAARVELADLAADEVGERPARIRAVEHAVVEGEGERARGARLDPALHDERPRLDDAAEIGRAHV